MTKDDDMVKIDRRARDDRRREKDRRQKAVPVENERRQGERRAKVQRRRQIDPTTCERDYTDEEILFMQALDDYKRASGRMFPTCSEILEVVKKLGYVRLDEDGQVIESAPSSAPALEVDEESADENAAEDAADDTANDASSEIESQDDE